MLPLASSSFVVVACAPGVEPWLKSELAREHPELKPSFSRPGLVTFKSPSPVSDLDLDLRPVFAAVVAVSLGEVPAAAAIADRARALASGGPLRLLAHAGPARVGERVRGADAEDRAETEGRHAREVREATLAALGADAARVVIEGEVARPGDRVLDLFASPGDATWLGVHRHVAGLLPWAAGWSPVVTPPEAPSRAFAKMEEALVWSGAPVRAGDTAIEIGSAPGGASLALLQRGVSVVGVDPAAMDPHVLELPGPARFTHVALPIGALKKGDLPARAHWVALDVNLAPPVALRYLERVVGPRRAHLLGVILTLKMNDDAMPAQLPQLLERVRGMGLPHLQVAQLPSNRREVCVVALSERGARRGSPRPRPR